MKVDYNYVSGMSSCDQTFLAGEYEVSDADGKYLLETFPERFKMVEPKAQKQDKK